MDLKNFYGIYRGDSFVRMKLGRFYLYLANYKMQPVRVEKTARRNRRRRLKHDMVERAGFRCEVCGAEIDFRNASIHHVLPKLYYPQFEFEPDNIMLCHSCHRMIHEQEKVEELGISPGIN